MMQGRILIVDDEQNILHAIKRLLRKESYEISTAVSGEEALAFLNDHQVDVIISDHRMPGMSGIEFLEHAKGLCPLSVRIILSGYADLKTVTKAINRGYIYKFILKPWDDEELKAAIREAINVAHLQNENYRLTEELKIKNERLQWLNNNLKDEIEKRTQELQMRNMVLERFHYIIHQMPIGFIGLGDDKRIAFANNWAYVHIGRLKDLLDQDIEAVLGTDAASRLDGLAHGEGPLSMTVDIDGMNDPIEMRGTVVRYPDGAYGYLLIFIDHPISSLKEKGASHGDT
ncbi:MAG: response regulator [Dissulfurimicrobium sp.]